MAFEKRPSSDQDMNKPRGLRPKPGSLADAHGKGINAESTHDLMGHTAETKTNEGRLGSQGEPQPSGGQPGMRPQLGSFEAGQTDLGPGMRGEDLEQGEPIRAGVNPGPHKLRKD